MESTRLGPSKVATVMTVICGYSLPIWRRQSSNLQTALNIYCLTITALFTALGAVYLLLKLRSVEFSCVGIVEYTISVYQVYLITYWPLKYYTCQQLNSNIYDNLAYIDNSLESLGIEVPRVRNNLEGMLFVAVSFTLGLIYRNQIFDDFLHCPPNERLYYMSVCFSSLGVSISFHHNIYKALLLYFVPDAAKGAAHSSRCREFRHQTRRQKRRLDRQCHCFSRRP